MNSRFRLRTQAALLLLTAACPVSLAWPVAAAPQDATAGEEAEPELPELSLKDSEVSTPSRRLLDLAFRTASAYPLDPHIKNRSRAQGSVIDEYLAQGQPHKALECVQQVANWRRGLGFASLAVYCAEHGDRDAALGFASIAEFVADHPVENEQAWRMDRIRTRAAQAHAILGDLDRAHRLEAGVQPSEAGKVKVIQASMSDADEFDAFMAWADEATRVTDGELARSVVQACIELFGRHYADEDRRAAAEERIRAIWGQLPRQVAIEASLELARHAREAGDREKALALVTEAIATKEEAKWDLQFDVLLSAQLARARYEAGDAAGGLEMATAALERYQEGSESIQGIFRADALRPLAQAFWAMGEVEPADLVFEMAIEAGAENPNARPRADDLTATCVAMVDVGYAPDEDLWKRMAAIHQGLAAPW